MSKNCNNENNIFKCSALKPYTKQRYKARYLLTKMFMRPLILTV